LPAASGNGGANPADYYGLGLIRPGNATAFWEPFSVIGGPQWMPLPAGTTRIGYALFSGAVVSVAEVAGASPLAFPLASLPDVAIASVSDAQVLAYSSASSKWINATPTGGGYTPPPFVGCRVQISTPVSCATNVQNFPAFDVELFDTDTMHDNATNPSRVTVKTAGKYLITAGVRWESSTLGLRHIWIDKNGGTALTEVIQGATGGHVGQVVTVTDDAAVNDYYRFAVLNTGTTTIQAGPTGMTKPWLSAVLLR